MEPKISFVVPTHNRIQWVAQCVGSLLGQDMKEVEVIVVDDGSEDGTYDMLTEWLKDEPRAKIVRNEVSIGAGESRNKGTALASAPIIGVCDDDDFYPSDRARNTLKFFESNPSGVMLTGSYLRVNLVDDPVQKFIAEEFDEKTFKESGRVNYFCHPAAAYTKKDFEEHGGYKKENETVTDDYMFLKRWIECGKKVGVISDDFLCYHRVLSDSIMQKHRGFNPEWNKPVAEVANV